MSILSFHDVTYSAWGMLIGLIFGLINMAVIYGCKDLCKDRKFALSFIFILSYILIGTHIGGWTVKYREYKIHSDSKQTVETFFQNHIVPYDYKIDRETNTIIPYRYEITEYNSENNIYIIREFK